MFRVRKLLLLGALMLAVPAMTAGAASAQLEVHSEAGPPDPCGMVSLSLHVVSGGCHVELQSEGDIVVVAYLPGPTPVSSCQWHLEAQIGDDGEGFVTEAALTPPVEPGGLGCVRAACDELDAAPPHPMFPWPIHLNEVAGVSGAEVRFCVRTTESGEGGAQRRCTVHLPLADAGGHNYELGTPAQEAFCEAGDFTFPVSIQGAHFLNEVDPEPTDEDIEIIH